MVAMELMLTSKLIPNLLIVPDVAKFSPTKQENKSISLYCSWCTSVIDTQSLNHRTITNSRIFRFDYIVRDSRACGLGCNFQPERCLFLSYKWLYFVGLDVLQFVSCDNTIVHPLFDFLLKYSTCSFLDYSFNLRVEINYNWILNFYWLFRLMETMQVIDDEICYRAKDC
jgi:hypothetical protein